MKPYISGIFLIAAIFKLIHTEFINFSIYGYQPVICLALIGILFNLVVERREVDK